jgi:predicted dehydrogenase
MRLGFLGTGWIGRHRLEAIAASGAADIVGIADSSPAGLDAARAIVPGATLANSLDELLECELDGLVIATPSALHAAQAITALERGVAVFCQKPVGRTGEETRQVVHAARAADRLLDADFSYRHVEGVRRIRDLARGGALGRLYAADLVFHNAYGPDKPWFYDPAQSGGGCMMDLGIHLADLALWLWDFPQVADVTSRLYAGGRPLETRGEVEDFAVATLAFTDGSVVRLACSWNLPAGRDAVIGLELIGTTGSAALGNIGGSFYDFAAELRRGTSREPLAAPPDDWGGRAAVAWVRRLARSRRFDPEAEQLAVVADVVDAIYSAAGLPAPPARTAPLLVTA